MAEEEDESDLSRRRKRGLLKLFYGSKGESATSDIYDINEGGFQHEEYLNKMFKEKNLNELMDKEAEVVREIRSLDSDMQTLVYENYNKFISATDTIKKMKSDFRKMEDEMDKLETTLTSLTEFSDVVNEAMFQKRSHISNLSGVHTLLHKLQFLFELPVRLQKCIEMNQFGLAVRYYTKARDVLQKYKHMASFEGIHKDCEVIISGLMTRLRHQLQDPDSNTKQLADCVDLLARLGEPPGSLCEEFLALAREKVTKSLAAVKAMVVDGNDIMSRKSTDNLGNSLARIPDILEFMDCGCGGFLSDIALIIVSYNELFMIRSSSSGLLPVNESVRQVARGKLNEFIMDNMADFFKYVRQRLEMLSYAEDSTIIVRALDKFYCKVQAVHQLFPESGMDRTSTNIVAFSAHCHVSRCLAHMSKEFKSIITNTRQALLSSKITGTDSLPIASIFQHTLQGIKDVVASVLQRLKAFINPDVMFSIKPYFRGPFCIDDIREGLLIGFFKYTLQCCYDIMAETVQENSLTASLMLILSRICLDMSEKGIIELVKVAENGFPVDQEIREGCIITSLEQLCSSYRSCAQELLNQYVHAQGFMISQMVRKSIESRDWLNTIEPRTVRAAMKRIIEDITVMDVHVGSLFSEGVRKAGSSDSSKWTHNYNNPRGSSTLVQSGQAAYGAHLDTSLLSNIQKLFSDRIEVFALVDFTKVSVLTGIVKICLKTLLESVRLHTFSKYGLQQMQVDTHYLQMYIWRFVDDENMVHVLLDEAVNSTIHRCLLPELMESSVVEMICERT